MDRNSIGLASFRASTVALRKESVDRNTILTQTSTNIVRSLSARRAWIEMKNFVSALMPVEVALRKESVDRNTSCSLRYWSRAKSLSARRAWIEISRPSIPGYLFDGRSPQGERG